MGVLEARPLFLYSGRLALVAAVGVLSHGFLRRPGRRCVVFSAQSGGTGGRSTSALGVHGRDVRRDVRPEPFRLLPGARVRDLGGWLATGILDWGGVPHANNPAPRSPRRAACSVRSPSSSWQACSRRTCRRPALSARERHRVSRCIGADSMTWLRDHTPPPFTVRPPAAGEEYYYARYPRDGVPPPDYTVMNWWDHGYWIVQLARRVPVANPTQERAPNCGAASTRDHRSGRARDPRRRTRRYRAVRLGAAVSACAGRDGHGPISERARLGRRRARGVLRDVLPPAERRLGAVWVFYEPYYRSMAFRLMVLGGAAAVPRGTTTVLVVADRVDETALQFKEIVSDNRRPLRRRASAALQAAQLSHTRLLSASIHGAAPSRPKRSPRCTRSTPHEQPNRS